MLSSSVERRSGCDGAIVITARNKTKVALFEAKLPRLSSQYAMWDYSQTATGLSHYSDQLLRQKNIRPEFAIFEMFYCDFPFGMQPSYMLDEVSSCLWRDDALLFDAGRQNAPNVWTQTDLVSMLTQNVKLGIDNILEIITRCGAGTPIKDMDGRTVVGEFALEGHILIITAQG
jgi:hypothetical protein